MILTKLIDKIEIAGTQRTLAKNPSGEDSPEKVKKDSVTNDSPKVFYRYNGYRGNIGLDRFIPIAKTKCGYWIIPEDKEYLLSMTNTEKRIKELRRWISKDSRKRYAYPTRELALDSYYQRKLHHIAILRSQVENIEHEMKVVKDHKAEIIAGSIPVYREQDVPYYPSDCDW